MSSLDTAQRPAPVIVFPQPNIPMLTNPQPVRETFSVISWVYAPTQDPFSLSFAEFSRLSYREALELQNEVCKSKSNLLNDAWRRGKRQIVICDGKIVYETESLEDIPNDKIMELAKTYDKACYVFCASDIVEESTWLFVEEEDYYPTIPLYLGAEHLDESHITQTQQIVADFDTGNPIYKIFDANQLSEPLSSFAPPIRTANNDLVVTCLLLVEETYWLKLAFPQKMGHSSPDSCLRCPCSEARQKTVSTTCTGRPVCSETCLHSVKGSVP